MKCHPEHSLNISCMHPNKLWIKSINPLCKNLDNLRQSYNSMHEGPTFTQRHRIFQMGRNSVECLFCYHSDSRGFSNTNCSFYEFCGGKCRADGTKALADIFTIIVHSCTNHTHWITVILGDSSQHCSHSTGQHSHRSSTHSRKRNLPAWKEILIIQAIKNVSLFFHSHR